jgi:hypothetical protein
MYEEEFSLKIFLYREGWSIIGALIGILIFAFFSGLSNLL